MERVPAYVAQTCEGHETGRRGEAEGGAGGLPPLPAGLPFVYVDVPIPPYANMQSPVSAPVYIPWCPSDGGTGAVPTTPARQAVSSQIVRSRPEGLKQQLVGGPVPPVKAAGRAAAGGPMVDRAEEYTSTVAFYVNDREVVLENPDPRMTLNDYLRSTPGLKGTKRMCNQGGCGVCTVLLTGIDSTSESGVKTVSINSCLRPVATLDGMHVTTIEGIGSTSAGLDPVQQAMVDNSASQCGMCTPGFAMQMKGLLVNTPQPTQEQIESHFDGNICRCTGYRPILDSFQSFAVSEAVAGRVSEKPRHTGGHDGQCSSSKPSGGCQRDIEDLVLCDKMKASLGRKTPAGRRVLRGPRKILLRQTVTRADGTESVVQWAHPLTLDALVSLIQTYPDANKKYVVGNTSSGIYSDADVELYIDIRNIPDLQGSVANGTSLLVGAATAITDFIQLVESVVAADPDKGMSFAAVLPHLRRIASNQIRNVGSIAGNLMITQKHDDFPSDFMLVCMTLGATLTYQDPLAQSPSDRLTVPVENIYGLDMSNKIIISIQWPFRQANEYVSTYKVALRKQFAHAIVNAGFRVVLDPATLTVQGTPTIVFGGILPQTVHATATEQLLVGKVWGSEAMLAEACRSLQQELTPDEGPGRVMYRRSLMNAYMAKFYYTALEAVQPGSVPSSLLESITPYVRPISTGVSTYDEDPIDYKLPQFVPKVELPIQVTGEAVYHIDAPVPPDTLHCSVVQSTEGKATIASIDITAAEAAPGVERVIVGTDIPGLNRCDTVLGLSEEYWEPVLAVGKVSYVGQAVALVLADTLKQAEFARDLVKVTYTDIQQPIVTTEQAVDAESFFPIPSIGPVTKGDVDLGLSNATNVLSGRVEVPAQAHFPMETQTTIAIPEDDGDLTLHCSTQFTSMAQYLVAKILGINQNKINVKCKRIGGSYGCKITRTNQIAGLASLGTFLSGRACSLQLSLQTNMEMIGKRHPYLADYSVGFDDDGRVHTLKAVFYANGGFTVDGTDGTTTSLVMAVDNAYNFDNFYAEGICCQTNLACNTYMRAPGFFPAVFFAEQVMENVAQVLGMTPEDVKRRNFYRRGDVTPYDQTLSYWSLTEIWEKMRVECQFDKRLGEITAFNSRNRYVKRGISMVPMKYGVLLKGLPFGALVSILADGTIVVSHGGTEVGQGINTKVIQAVARGFNIDISLVRVACHQTLTTPNQTATGGSITSELCVQAVLTACKKLRMRIDPFKAVLHATNGRDPTWKEVVHLCVTSGVDMSATGHEFYAPSDKQPYTYNSYGVTCVEVRVDTLTGETEVLRTDVRFDCGTSLNPLVDMGQVQGSVAQGIGYYLTELLTFDDKGKVLSNDTWEYKPPLALDIAVDFRCHLEKNAPNERGILSSKASGEPPMCMMSAVFWAVQHAILSARKDNGFDPTQPLMMDVPATVDNIVAACGNYASLQQ